MNIKLYAKRYTLNAKGFTLIEVITSITLIAIIMLPIAMICMEFARSASFASNAATGTNLARYDIAIVNNLSYAAVSSQSTPDYVDAGYDADLDRTVSVVGNRKLVRSRILRHNTSEKKAELDTYVMNVGFGAGSGGGVSGTEAGSFAAGGGSLDNNSLDNVSITNSRTTGNITITAIKIEAEGNNKTLENIRAGLDTPGNDGTIDRMPVDSVNISLPVGNETLVQLAPYIIIPSGTTYSGSRGMDVIFADNDNSYNIYITFVFSDGTESSQYSWINP